MKVMSRPFLVFSMTFLLITKLWSAGFKIYGYKTRDRGEIELVYLNNYIAQSELSQNFFGKQLSREGHLSHSFEIEYGVTDRLTLASYFDLEQPKDEGLKYTRFRCVFLRYRFFEPGDYFFNPALYLEYYIPKKSYKNEEELEIKLILEKKSGKFTLLLNPSFEKVVSGEDVTEGLKFQYAVGTYYAVTKKFRLGLEMFSKIGELSAIDEKEDQRHWIFPSIKMKLPGHIGWELGAGFGLTDASDDLIVKNFFSIEF